MKKYQQGFTLIELMIVIAILGILIAIALPAYQDYTVRAKFSECVNGLAAMKTGVSEYEASNGRFPQTLASIGSAFDSKYCNAASLGANGVLTIANSASAGVAASTVTVTLTPDTNGNGDINWACTATGLVKYAPSSCR